MGEVAAQSVRPWALGLSRAACHWFEARTTQLFVTLKQNLYTFIRLLCIIEIFGIIFFIRIFGGCLAETGGFPKFTKYFLVDIFKLNVHVRHTFGHSY